MRVLPNRPSVNYQTLLPTYLAARNSSSSATRIVSLPSNGSVPSVPTASSNMAGSILRMQAKKISSSRINFKVADNMLNERYIEKSE